MAESAPGASQPATPPGLALVRATIRGARALAEHDRLRAAALLLAREFAANPARLRLAVRLATAHNPSGDDCLIVWHPEDHAPPESDWPALADGDSVYWFDSPGGYAVGPGGTIELTAPTAARLPERLPAALLMLIAASPGVRRLRLLDAAHPPSAELIAHWEAATGLAIETGTRAGLPALTPSRLQPVPPAPPPTHWEPIDRALVAIAVAASLAFLATAARAWLTLDTPAVASAPTSAAAPGGSAAGLLLLRILHAAPSLAESTTAADYGDGRWVLTVKPAGDTRAVEADLLRRFASNGLSAQSITVGEELRVRLERMQP